MGFFENERWQWIKTEWAAAHYSNAINMLLNGLPNMTYPGSYDETQDHNPWSPVFWWRELWHFISGFAIGFACSWLWLTPLPAWACVLIPTLGVAGSMFYKEFFLDVLDQPNQQWDFKNVIDATTWTLGCLSLNLLFCLL